MNSQAKVVSSSMYNNSTISNVPVVGGPINVEWENWFMNKTVIIDIASNADIK